MVLKDLIDHASGKRKSKCQNRIWGIILKILNENCQHIIILKQKQKYKKNPHTPCVYCVMVKLGTFTLKYFGINNIHSENGSLTNMGKAYFKYWAVHCKWLSLQLEAGRIGTSTVKSSELYLRDKKLLNNCSIISTYISCITKLKVKKEKEIVRMLLLSYGWIDPLELVKVTYVLLSGLKLRHALSEKYVEDTQFLS